MKNIVFKVTSVVIIICMIATIFIPFSVKSSQTTLTSMYDTGRGVGNTSVWKNIVKGYSNTYCVRGGASLYVGAQLNDKGSIYTNSFTDITSNQYAIRWLLDNIYLDEGVDNVAQSYMVHNLKHVVKEYASKKDSNGVSWLAKSVGIKSIDDTWINNAVNAMISDKDTLFAVQQYALWTFVNNSSSKYVNAIQNSDGSYNKLPNAKIDKQYYIGYYVTLREMAKSAQNNKYQSPNSTGKFGINLQANSPVAKLQSDKKTMLIGPYTFVNNHNQAIKVLTATVNSENANSVQAVNEKGQVIDIKTYTGKFYFKIGYNKGFSKGKNYTIKMNVNVNGYKTFANILYPSGDSTQPIVSIRKEAYKTDLNATYNYNEKITGKYNLVIYKTGNNNQALPGTVFKVKNPEGSEKTYTTSNSGTIAVANDIEIKKPETVTYTVTEIQTSDNTYAQLADAFQVNIKLEEVNEEYKPTKVSFANGQNYKDVKLKNGTEVRLLASISGDTVKVTVPNRKITGSYSMEILKKDEKGTALAGVTFRVKQGTNSPKVFGPTNSNGVVNIANETITAKGVDEYTIDEIKTMTNYVILKEPLNVYVTKEIRNYKFEVINVSFEKNKVVTSKKVDLKDGSKVTVNAKLSNGKISITIPNKKIEGNYSLEIQKVDEKNKPLSGVNFNVIAGNSAAKIYGPTDSNGIVNIINNLKIEASGVDEYTIKEISSKDNQYITLKDDLKVYITKEIQNYKYVVGKVSLDKNKIVTSKDDVELKDGSKVKVTLSNKNGKVTVTIPNKKIEGSYGIEIKKIEFGSSLPLAGAFFTVKEGTSEAKQIGPTNSDGSAVIVTNKQIIKEGIDEYTISEVKIDKDYITLKESFKIYVTKEMKNYKYVASKVSFENGKETKTKSVTLKDGSKVTVTAKVSDGKVIITVPNKRISGNYSLEIEKINSENISEKIQGVTFKVQEGSKEAKEYGPTGEDGKVTIFEGKNITNIGVDEYTITELELNQDEYYKLQNNIERAGFIKIKDSFKVYVTKKIKDNNYQVTKVSFEKEKEVKTKKVELEDGTKVTLELTLTGNHIKVTVPNKPEERNLQFDMALRKYITKVTRDGKEVNIGESRTPVINEFSADDYEKTKTAGYYHTKAPVTVKPGDVVLYTLRIYNEGEIAGFAKEITDYLPQGLEYIENSSINKANNWIVVKNENGETAVKTDKLKDTLIKPANGAEGFRDFAKAESKKAPEFSSDVQIECKVKSNIQDKKLLVNVAEITNYGYKNDNGQYIEANKKYKDIDSIENTVFGSKKGISNISEYYDNVVVPQDSAKNKKYKGLEDDDDFESVYVEPDLLDMKFVLNKVDEDGNPLIGADFTVEREKDKETQILLNNKEVNGTYEVIESDVRYNKTYSYKVVEDESAPGYVNVMEGKYITIRTYMGENKKLVLGGFEKNQEEKPLIKKYGFIINNIDGTIVKENETDLYTKIKVEIKNNTKQPQIVITIPNEKITGSYSLELEKVDSSDSNIKLKGATFEVQNNGKTKQCGPTAEDGKVLVANKIKIEKEGIDEYTISELSLTDETYIQLKESFKIYVNTTVKDNKYVAGKVSFENGKNIETKEVTLKDESKVKVSVKLQNNKILVTIPNKKVTGNYSLELIKINSENPSEKLEGVTFNVQEGSKEAKEYGPTDKNGKVTVEANKEITNLVKDEYTIQEVKLNQENFANVSNNVKREGFIKIKEGFKIYITKEVKDNSYKVTKVSFENGKDVKTKKVELEDGTKVTVKAEIVGNVVKITIPNKPILKQLNFDLALRKYITKVTRNGKEVNIGENRIPVINEFSVQEYEETRTAGYYHTKNPVTVKPGDVVLYSLRVYNEGDIEGYAKEITDFLPQGLEYVENSNINKENDWVALKNDDGTTTVKTSKLSQTVIKPANGVDGLNEYVSLGTETTPKFSEYVQIECKVKRNIQDKKLLVNVAEITNYGYYNDEKEFVEANQKNVDIDSIQNNVFVKENDVTNINEYYDKVVIPQSKENNKHYKGLEDDDDFENIYVEPDQLEIEFVLNKVDEEGKPLIGADFTVEREKDGETKVLLNNEEVKGTYDVIEKAVKYNKTYSYKVVEVESAPGYVNVMEGKYITLRTYMGEDKKLVLGSFEQIEEEKNLINKYGFIINNTDGSIVKENETDLYTKIKVQIKNDSKQQVVITIPNEKITGSYSLELIKINSENSSEKIEGVTFKVQEGSSQVKEYGPTDKNGKIVVETNKEITNIQTDEYTIQEMKLNQENYSQVENNIKREGFISIKDSFKIYITKAVVDNNYKITKISFENNKDVKSKEVELEDGTKVTLSAEIVGNVVRITVPNKPNTKQLNFDLALRKFITAVTKNVGTDKQKQTDIINRIPTFKIDKDGKYVYEHTKNPVVVSYGNIVTYTLRVYNEGDIDGYAKIIKDDIPEGLEFLPEEPLNKVFRWIMLDKNGKETKDIKNAVYVSSDYLSKEQEKESGTNLIKAFDKTAFEEGKIKEPNYKEVKVSFKVVKKDKFDELVINKAQISDDSDKDGNDITDIDSTPDKWIDGEDDQDIEKVKVQYFDLSLRKWVTKAITIENGVKTVSETGHKAEDNPEQIVKVDLKDSKIKDVTVKFEYSIRVKNEGQIAGYAKEISDYIPQGLKFVKEDNPDWVETDGKVVTEKLKDKQLKPGETAEVTIILTWINDSKNMGLKVNTAEISKDYNDDGSPDIDSVPNNKVPGEDDIDDAPVMLTVKTGQEVTYIALAGIVFMMLASGTVLIKKFVLK